MLIASILCSHKAVKSKKEKQYELFFDVKTRSNVFLRQKITHRNILFLSILYIKLPSLHNIILIQPDTP